MIECASVVVRVQERVRMPRYFFNFVGNEGSVLDTQGVELTDIATVRTYAHKRAAELAEAAGQDKDISGWRIQICDETGLPVMSLAAESERPGATEPGLACSNVQGVSQTER
jgi:hypothetical protein